MNRRVRHEQWTPIAIGIVGLVVWTAGGASGADLAIDLSAAQPGKDLSNCWVGADGESWAYSVGTYNEWLGPWRGTLARAFRDCGLKVFRLATGDTAGPYSCTKFFTGDAPAAPATRESTRLRAKPHPILPGIQWWVSADPKLEKLTAVIFNTHSDARPVRIAPPSGWRQVAVERAEALAADNIWEGYRQSDPQPWRMRPIR